MAKSFRWSKRTPDTKSVVHAPGNETTGMDAYDLEAMRDSFAMNRANGNRTIGRALVRGVALNVTGK